MTETPKIISDWQCEMVNMSGQIDVLTDTLMVSPDSPLLEAIWAVMGLTINAINEVYPGIDVYLDGWWHEDHLGGRPMRIGFKGEPMRELKTIDEVFAFYMEDIERGEK